MKKIAIIIVVVIILIFGWMFLFAKKGNAPTQTPTQTATLEATSTVTQTLTPTSSPAQSTTASPTSELLTMSVVALHNSKSDCWSAVNGKVYNLTSYINKHPGGPEQILSICGKDGTSLFAGQHDSQPKPNNALAGLLVGDLAK